MVHNVVAINLNLLLLLLELLDCSLSDDSRFERPRVDFLVQCCVEGLVGEGEGSGDTLQIMVCGGGKGEDTKYI